jgi:hypothetical protein
MQMVTAFKSAGGSFDTDAQAFFTAAGITDSTQKSAVNQLVLDLKSASIWTKMVAIYPFVGGTSTTHKYNLKDPRDLDAAFRLTFSGTVTQDANGITPNGTTGFADTHYVDSTSGTLDSFHCSYYSRTAAQSGSTAEIGALGGGFRIQLRCRDSLNAAGCGIQNGISSVSSITDGSGLFTASRTVTATANLMIRGSNNAITQSSTGRPTASLYIGAINNGGTAQLFSNKNCAFVSFGQGLTTTEMGNLNTAVVTFQTTLGRNV